MFRILSGVSSVSTQQHSFIEIRSYPAEATTSRI
jgi:hypothetical protein